MPAAAWSAGSQVRACAVVAAVLVLPDGWLPIPPAPGAWSGPAYVGRPATAPPVPAAEVAPHPHLAAAAATRPGPLGLQPEVETSWFGLQRCGRLELTSTDDLVALCTDRSGPSLRLVDPVSMRPTTTRDLPDARGSPPAPATCSSSTPPTGPWWRRRIAGCSPCARPPPRVSRSWRSTRPGTSSPTSPTATASSRWPRTGPAGPGGPHGRASSAPSPPTPGRSGSSTSARRSRRGLAADEGGGVHVVTDAALHRLAAGPDGTPQTVWRTAYDGESGSPPVLLEGGVVAITDSADERMGVLFVARDGGAVICRQPVFEEGASATDERRSRPSAAVSW